jgi:hypothetical protein
MVVTDARGFSVAMMLLFFVGAFGLGIIGSAAGGRFLGQQKEQSILLGLDRRRWDGWGFGWLMLIMWLGCGMGFGLEEGF